MACVSNRNAGVIIGRFYASEITPTANISGVAGEPQDRTMTHATVTGVQSRTLTLKYKDDEAEIVVAPDVPIITLVVGDASLLKPGAAVAIVAGSEVGGLGGMILD